MIFFMRLNFRILRIILMMSNSLSIISQPSSYICRWVLICFLSLQQQPQIFKNLDFINSPHLKIKAFRLLRWLIKFSNSNFRIDVGPVLLRFTEGESGISKLSSSISGSTFGLMRAWFYIDPAGTSSRKILFMIELVNKKSWVPATIIAVMMATISKKPPKSERSIVKVVTCLPTVLSRSSWRNQMTKYQGC